ncbi:MAG TPA: hypothetical protein PLB02_08855, partial [Thermoanaerobaculia bacterium]|nr:hypothetical protein [Thermoanaerobaculia bacterium]
MPSSLRSAVNGDAVCLVALAAAGLALLAGGALRRLRPVRLWGPPAGFLLGSVTLLAAAGRLPPAVTVAGLLALAGAGGLLASAPEGVVAGTSRARRTSLVVLAVSTVAAGVVIFPGLGDPAQALQAWEPDVFSWLEAEMTAPFRAAGALAGRLLWQQGLLSSGGDSLFYGLPTVLLLSGVQASVLSLRIAAALLALLSLFACWAVCRRFFGDGVAACATVLWLLAPPFLFYGRYGTSVTAMWAALWLAVGAVLALLSRPSAGRAALAALALYAATLQYAPGRIVAVALLGLAAVALPVASGSRFARARAALALAALVAPAVPPHPPSHP